VRRPGRLAILVVAVALVAGCGPSATWRAPAAGGSPGPTGSAGGSAAPGSIAWTDCADQAKQYAPRLAAGVVYECGTLSVPRDWAAPNDGQKFDLALLRARSQHQSKRIGSLVINPGGPGGSGVETAAFLPLELPQAIMDRFDVVGFDPRGVGHSSPSLRCLTDADLDTTFGGDGDPTDQAGFDALTALWQRIGQQCQARYGDTLGKFSTRQAARDMEALRAALGDPKLTYLGWSYGTLLGAVYAQLYPKNIRAFVLDGAVDPTLNSVDGSHSQLTGFEHAFDQFAAWCKENTCPAGPDARTSVKDVLATARTAPVAGPGGRKATAGWIITGVSEAMYAKQLWPNLGQAIADLAAGKATRIFDLADEYAQRDGAGHYSNLFDAFTTIGCDDDAGRLTVAQIRAYQTQWRTEFPLFGGSFATGLLTCLAWPATRDPYPTGKAAGAPPIVVVGTRNDPATPYAQTQKLADMLGNSTVLTWEGDGHTAYPQTSCIRAAVDAYLISLEVPPRWTTCPA